MRIALFFGMLVLLTSTTFAQKKAPLPDCKKLYQITEACSTGFKSIRGPKKNLKYSEVYESKLKLPLTTHPEIQVFGKGAMFSARIARTGSYNEACKAYRNFVAWMEECIPNWIFITDPEDKSQLFLFKAYENEDMDTGTTIEVVLTKLKNGQYSVDFHMQT